MGDHCSRCVTVGAPERHENLVSCQSVAGLVDIYVLEMVSFKCSPPTATFIAYLSNFVFR